MNQLTNIWATLDAAVAKGKTAYIETCKAVVDLADVGKATQEEIALRHGWKQSAVAKMMKVGNDQRIIRNANNLPADNTTLYELTTLDDPGFKLLCKPDVKRKAIKDYKDTMNANDPKKAARQAAKDAAKQTKQAEKQAEKAKQTQAEIDALNAQTQADLKAAKKANPEKAKAELAAAKEALKKAEWKRLEALATVVGEHAVEELMQKMQATHKAQMASLAAKSKWLDETCYVELKAKIAEAELELERMREKQAQTSNKHISGEDYAFIMQQCHPDKQPGNENMAKVHAILGKLAVALNTRMSTTKMVNVGILKTGPAKARAEARAGIKPSLRPEMRV